MTDAGAGLCASLCARLCVFLRDRMQHGVPDAVLHEAKRLLLNQLKASVSAIAHPSWQILHDWAVPVRAPAQPVPGHARVLWSSATTPPAQAAVVNGASFALRCFGDTHLPSRQSATAAVLAAVLARSEAGGHDGHDLLTALALGLEAALAWATLAGPGPQALAVGAAGGCGVLAGLSAERLHEALAWAAGTCPANPADRPISPEAAAVLTGLSARAGLDACEWVQRGLPSAPGAWGVDAAALGDLGPPWRLFQIAYHTVPAPALAHAPIDAALALWARARTRRLARMHVRVAASALGAASDLRPHLAAAWQRGQYTLAEQQAVADAGPELLALNARIDVTADPTRQRPDGCTLSVEYADGSVDTTAADDVLGAPGRPLTDSQLCELFRGATEDRLSPTRAGEILQAVWALHAHPDMSVLMRLLRQC